MSLINDLIKSVLVSPALEGADEFCVVSGYATATMTIRHLEILKLELDREIPIKIIVGMCSKDGISRSQHRGFRSICNGEISNVNLECNYVVDSPPVHAKVYSWLKNGVPVKGFVGSANYTQNAFSTSMREILVDYDPRFCYSYFKGLLGETVSCLEENIEEQVTIIEDPKLNSLRNSFESQDNASSSAEKVTLSLLVSQTGETPNRSGINWGQRGGRNPDQAYIHIPADIARSGFFPPRSVQFTVTTDDEKELVCVRAQDNGKGLHTTLDNSKLGLYLRYRMGLNSGVYVTRADLLKYGRTDIDFYKINEESFYLDFSVQE